MDFEDERALFQPPMATQRYIFVRETIQKLSTAGTPIRSVLDLGCSDCRLVPYLRQLPFVQQIACVDVDVENLERSSYNLKVAMQDLLAEAPDRPNDQVVRLYVGSALELEPSLATAPPDVVTCIELVEHLQPSQVGALAANVFGHIRPKVAIISTPNYEFNDLIRREVCHRGAQRGEFYEDHSEPPKFRDRDHKFEWTRAQFGEWCAGAVATHPEYEFELDGVGQFDWDKKKDTGFCTQIAIFRKKTVAEVGDAGDSTPPTNGLMSEQFQKYNFYKKYDYNYLQTDEQASSEP